MVDVPTLRIAERLLRLKAETRWRPYSNSCSRLALAWAFSYGIFLVCNCCSLVYGARIGEAGTKAITLAWGVALFQNFVLLEPLQIFVAAAAPCLCDDATALGRCGLRLRFVYNEIFSP